MAARLGILSLVALGIVACSSSPDWVGDGPDVTGSSPTTPKPTAGDDECVPTGGSGGGSSSGGASTGGGAKAGLDVDVTSLSACCEDKGKAHCVPDEKVPASTRASLDACPSGGLCIPDSIIQGVAPAPCDSGYGEGVCVSLCVKAIADKASLLKQATCKTNEVCAPCISPLDNKPTGACELGKPKATPQSTPGTPCSPKSGGSTSPAPAPSGSSSSSSPSPSPSTPAPSGGGGGLTACCGGQGACVPESAVPEAQKEKLEQKECASAQLCAPKENIDKNFVPKACKGESFTGDYDGVCLSNCIAFDFLEKAISGQGTCDSDHRCVPCKTPFGTDTGAPGCK